MRWISQWVQQRPGVSMAADEHGNLTVRRTEPFAPGEPLYVTAHLDHPGFVVDSIEGQDQLVLAFRGGVMDDYFHQAAVRVHPLEGPARPARVIERIAPDATAGDASTASGGQAQAAAREAMFPRYRARMEDGWTTDGLSQQDIATWRLPEPSIDSGLLSAPACDDLAAVAAALAAFDELLAIKASGGHVGRDYRLFFTRAEEVGFIGALGACRSGSIPDSSPIITLENSRAFDDSPIGGGPIVRVGDRLTVFTPRLTSAVAARAEAIAGGPATPTASQKNDQMPRWRWQRKLMPGGACEATVFCAAGYDATCVCLPLGNYHNMADLAAVQAGTNTAPPTVGPEQIAISDFDGLVDLLVACGQSLSPGADIDARLARLWDERRFILDEAPPAAVHAG
ncbi:MAG: hypothetical protein KatS3mg103_0046 [Phycisphaerales bacterium]|nr:MAG: hypothetical protein KatS3mg103_0046 [Phycisphaerales bacterium]